MKFCCDPHRREHGRLVEKAKEAALAALAGTKSVYALYRALYEIRDEAPPPAGGGGGDKKRDKAPGPMRSEPGRDTRVRAPQAKVKGGKSWKPAKGKNRRAAR